jgi:hypothetical protein
MRRLVPVALVLALAGCAQPAVPWSNPHLPQDQWRTDWNGCRRWADGQVGYQDPDEGTLFSDYDRARARKQMDALTASCMRERGYVPTRK